jgi:hypothetical protein
MRDWLSAQNRNSPNGMVPERLPGCLGEANKLMKCFNRPTHGAPEAAPGVDVETQLLEAPSSHRAPPLLVALTASPPLWMQRYTVALWTVPTVVAALDITRECAGTSKRNQDDLGRDTVDKAVDVINLADKSNGRQEVVNLRGVVGLVVAFQVAQRAMV